MTCDETHPLIGAYNDGELAPATRQAVERHLADCAECRTIASDYRSLGRELAERGVKPARPELRQRVSAALARERTAATLSEAGADPQTVPGTRASPPIRRPFLGWQQMAAALALCVTSSLGTLLAVQSLDQVAGTETELVAAHTRALLQDNPLQVLSSDSHTVRPWFAGRVEFAPGVKDLAAQGYPLIGGRLDLVQGKRVAVTVYKHNLHWIDVYMWPESYQLKVAPGLSTRTGYNMMTWSQDGVVYTAVSDVNQSELRQFQALL